MLKKSRIWRILLLLFVIVVTNVFVACVHKYYPPPEGSQYQTKQEAQIKELQKEIEELKKQQ